MDLLHFSVFVVLMLTSCSTGFELKQCSQVISGSRPVLCSNQEDYRKNEQPPGFHSKHIIYVNVMLSHA